jgi:hypothetical protein
MQIDCYVVKNEKKIIIYFINNQNFDSSEKKRTTIKI